MPHLKTLKNLRQERLCREKLSYGSDSTVDVRRNISSHISLCICVHWTRYGLSEDQSLRGRHRGLTNLFSPSFLRAKVTPTNVFVQRCVLKPSPVSRHTIRPTRPLPFMDGSHEKSLKSARDSIPSIIFCHPCLVQVLSYHDACLHGSILSPT